MLLFDITGLFLLYSNTSLPNWLVFIINAIAFFFILKLGYFVFKKVLKLIISKTKTTLDDDLLRITEYPLICLLCVIFIFSSTSIFKLGENTIAILNNIYYALIVAIVCWFLYSLIGIIYTYVLVPFAKRSKSELDNQVFPIVRKILRVIVVVFGIIYVLDIFGVNITPLLAGAGIVGLAIAFAAQKILADLFGGISILMDESLFVKDRIKVNNVEGDVVEIGLRGTKIKTLDNNIVTIPNSIMSSNNIENFTRRNRAVTVRIKLGITYETPTKKLEKAKSIINNILKKNKLIENNLVLFTEFADSSLILLVIFTVKDYAEKGRILDVVNTQIKKEFDKNKIEFAFPTRTIYTKK